MAPSDPLKDGYGLFARLWHKCAFIGLKRSDADKTRRIIVDEMIYRTLGKTGLKVPIVGYSASPLGDAFGVIDLAEGKRAVDRGIDAGRHKLL
jgi:hypothetical protein